MPRTAESTQPRILDAAYKLFRRRGYSRVSMDEIAAASKVTKRTLYYHFESKDHLLSEVLEAQHHLAFAAFRTFGDNLSGSPEAIVEGLFHELAVWSDKPRWAGSASRALSSNSRTYPGTPRVSLRAGTRRCSKAIWPTCSRRLVSFAARTCARDLVAV